MSEDNTPANFDSEKIIEIILVLIVLYFAWGAQPAVDYYANLAEFADSNQRKDNDFVASAMWFLFWLAPIALMSLTVGLPAAIIFANSSQNPMMGGWLLVWGALGWWVGRQFRTAVAEKAQCMAESTFGFGCTLNAPLFSYLAYSAISALLLLLLGLQLLSLWASKKEG
jgi:hypothetical protein